MARLGARRNGGTEPLRVVSDQIGAPTNTEVLAGALEGARRVERAGDLSPAPTGAVSWYEYARTIFKCLGLTMFRLNPAHPRSFHAPPSAS